MPAVGVSDGQSVPAGVRVAAAWSWRIIAVIAGIYVLGRLLGAVTTVLIPVLLAALVASLISPVTQALRRLRFPAILASLSSILALFLVVFGLLGLAGQQMISGFSQLSDSAMAGVNALIGLIEDLPFDFSTDRLNELVDQGVSWLQSNSGEIASGAMSFGATAGNFLTGFFIMVFTLIFFLADGERIWLFIVKLFPRPAQAAVNGSGRKAWISLGQYVRVQGFVAFIDAVGIGLGAFVLGVPLAVPLAILVFIGSWIPLVGAVVTGAIGVLVALVANGPMAALGMLAVVIIVQQLEGNVLQPLIMGQAVSLHPLAVFLAVAAGSVVAGILGALFAVPLLAMVNSVVRYLSSRAWEHDPDIAWQPYLYPWEIRRKAKAKELTREEVLQQFRRFSRTRRNEEAKSRNKEAEKDVTQRERDRALEAAERVSEAERRRHARQKEHHDVSKDAETPQAKSTQEPGELEQTQAARMPQGLGEDVGAGSPGDRVIAGADDEDPTPPEQDGTEGADGPGDSRRG
ncbi:AI-2E family transporter [Kocuria sp. p3-SID1433]|uniref:AI-2E family transporter n=1 Tax=unclassified Kocuria TaxID=2649579 RepID=UPI0021A3D1C3|nr:MULTISPECIES: AI-2E family transporter [unclassified Kocuria]MCT1601217.1 AI-2E family transporter [Kocuria sp. p3-SID1428]MCT2179811.1 AI-2E family transporter [Kocuria sp. p3-SID1433]